MTSSCGPKTCTSCGEPHHDLGMSGCVNMLLASKERIHRRAQRAESENQRLREVLNALMAAVNAHLPYWEKVSWSSEQYERAIFAALDDAKAVLLQPDEDG